MEIGFCGGVDRMKTAAEAGFDYMEWSVAAMAALSSEHFASIREGHGSSPLPTPCFNCLFPGTLSLLRPETANADILAYLKPALARVAALGGETVVFGSGKARMRPEDVPFDAAWRRLTEVTRLIGDTAAEFGLSVVIEPLSRRETNMVNSVAEGACLAASADHPNVALLADYYHISEEHQPPEDLARVGGIRHAHIASAVGRRVPVAAEEGMRLMFRAMKDTGYQGRISVEAGTDDLLRDGQIAVSLLRRLWGET